MVQIEFWTYATPHENRPFFVKDSKETKFLYFVQISGSNGYERLDNPFMNWYRSIITF